MRWGQTTDGARVEVPRCVGSEEGLSWPAGGRVWGVDCAHSTENIPVSCVKMVGFELFWLFLKTEVQNACISRVIEVGV